MGSFLAFLGLAIIVIVTPGPDTAITIRNTLLGGRMGGVMTALGVAVGQTTWALATSAGLVALLIASAPLFLAVQYAGAAYLIYLGLQALREAVWPLGSAHTTATIGGSTPSVRPFVAFRQGMISDLGNPKMAVFFASLLPQFVSPDGPMFSAFLILGVIFALMTFAWLALYVAFISKLGDFVRQSSVRRTIEAVAGTLLIGLGLRVAIEQR
jgi:threonine/homoserine/homoserine lactone efflux protein